MCIRDRGYKTSPDLEDKISELVYALCKEEREIDDIDKAELSQPNDGESVGWAQKHHPLWLSERFESFKWIFGKPSFSTKLIHQPLPLDSSKGSASTWFADWLTLHGIETKEVSLDAVEINNSKFQQHF